MANTNWPLNQTPMFDQNGNLSSQWFLFFNSINDALMAAGSGAGGADGWFAVDIDSSDQVQVDLANGLDQYLQLMNVTAPTVIAPIFSGGTIEAGSRFNLIVDQPGMLPGPEFVNAAGAFTSDAGQQVSPYAATRSVFSFIYDGTYWFLWAFRTGIATS